MTSLIIVLLFSISLWQLAAAGWIQGKALVAQQLLNHSWHKTLIKAEKDEQNKTGSSHHRASIHKPWPWADTWPVAKLIVPRQDIEHIVLAGDSGSSLAFGPGYSLASAAPNTSGTTLISAHRDTHFQFLKDIKINDEIYLQTSKATIRYRVYDLQVVDSKTFVIDDSTEEKTLVLATCYPFESLTSGGSSRYLVYAKRYMT